MLFWGYADDAGMVSRSPRGLERMMAVFVEAFVEFGLTIYQQQQDGDHVHADSARAASADILQRHGATVPPDNLLYLFGGCRS